ncbi:MAG: GNAT family N-acetyltransferase [Deltaproteobacteria bacterium]|nr:GNAT family N-acetyltransferase [Deltaproteobacteria bacterium]
MRRTTGTDPAFVTLVKQLDEELVAIYGDVQVEYAKYNKLEVDTAVVASIDGTPVGCGCFKPFPGDAAAVELKRMFVAPMHRGEGVARAVMGELEAWARELGRAAVVLETGSKQHDAVRLYERAGYARIPNYPPYDAMALSICMRKSLG